MIPNLVIRSRNVSVYEKAVYCAIASCGNDAFPSYECLQEWTGLSRDRIWKALRKLEEVNAIRRFKRGVQVYYRVHWADADPAPEQGFERINYAPTPSVRHTDGSVRPTDSISPPDGTTSVRPADPIKNQEKESLKNAEEIFGRSETRLAPVIPLQAEARA